jgi:hypothetical protein
MGPSFDPHETRVFRAREIPERHIFLFRGQNVNLSAYFLGKWLIFLNWGFSVSLPIF